MRNLLSRFRLPGQGIQRLALAFLVYACTSDHSPTAPSEIDQSDPQFATAAAVTAKPGGPYTGVEGAAVTFDGTASTGIGLTYDWDFGDATTHGTGATPAHAYADNKKYQVKLVVTDATGAKSKAAGTTATIANALPVLGTLPEPTPVARATVASTFSAPFTDGGTIDRHTGTFTWGDGASTAATIAEASGSGSASATHTFAAPGTYAVSLRVVDNNGGADTVKLSLVVRPANRAPVAVVGGPYAGVEGSEIAFDGSASSDPDGDTFTYDWDFGDGSAHGTTAAPTHVFADNGSFAVKLVLTDAYGLKSAVSQTTATVTNASPVVTSFSARPPTGGAVTVDGSFTDAGTRDVHTAAIDWGDGQSSAGAVQESGGNGTATASHMYAASGSYNVSLRISDNAGSSATSTTAVTVDVPPAQPPVASPGGPYGAAEGQLVAFDGTGSTSPNGGTLSYDWDFGDGSAHGSGSSPTHAYGDNGAYTVTLVVSDGGPAPSQPAQTTATITNAAPVLGALSGPSSATLGVAVTVSAGFTDAGTLDTHVGSVDWGDGSSDVASVSESNGSGSVSGTHAYASVGSYTVTLTLVDDDNSSSTGTFAVTVTATNNAPVANAGGPYAAGEGGSITFNGSASRDPDGDVITYDWNFGDNTAHGVGVAPKHAYLNNGSYVVTLVVTDSRGASSAPSQTTATVSNAIPVITLTRGPAAPFPADHPIAVSATFTDGAGVVDQHVASIAWGDGSTTSPARLYDSTTSTGKGWGALGGVHTYSAPGTYTATITVSDKDGGTATSDLTLTATQPGSSQVLLAAGDIALCTANGDRQTSLLLDQFDGWVQTLGDNAYPNGTDVDFANCYDPADSWGKQKDRTHPAPGNHEYYGTADAAGYFNYFGAAAGNRGQGYYSYNLGAWHIVVANAEIPVALNTPQNIWLRNDLASNTLQCVAVVVHEPLFSSDPTGPSSKGRPIWDAAYQYHVTLMLSGHAHVYERYAPQTPAGVADPNGVRQFVAGTGGDGNISRLGTVLPNSEVQYFGTFGILKLTLDPGSYTWQFVPTSGTFTDAGTASCVAR